MSIEANLQARILELEATLRGIRDSVQYNMEEPGNEHDTFDSITWQIGAVLHDAATYQFDMEKYFED